MKRFKVTIVLDLELPDDFEVAVEKREDAVCLKRDRNYYQPTVDWLGRELCFDGALFGEFETAPGIQWKSVDDDTGNDFINSILSEEYKIERI